MTTTPSLAIAAAARNFRRVALLTATVASAVALAAAAHGAPGDPFPRTGNDGMHGDPGAAAPYWHRQQQNLDCGEMAVADVVGQITGHEPTEDEVTAAAEAIPSVIHGGPIYRPEDRTSNGDLPVLLAHYGIHANAVHPNLGTLIQDLDQGHKVIVGLNDKIIWNESGDRSVENHFVVVTGIESRGGPGAGTVHLNDSGFHAGRDEQVSLDAFTSAWSTSRNFAVVTN